MIKNAMVAFLGICIASIVLVAQLSAQVHSEPNSGASTVHVEADPTHNFGGPNLGNPMEWKADGALFSLIVFLMLLATLWAFAWKPIKEGLEKRERSIAAHIAMAKKASDDAAIMLKEYHDKIAAAQAQSQDLVAQARKDAEASGQRILAEARAEAGRQRDRALSDIEAAKQAALSELASKSTDLAFSLARQVVGRELKADDHKQLIQEALKQMPSTPSMN